MGLSREAQIDLLALTCIDNSETVLKMLHLTMQSHERTYDNIVQNCLAEHVGYGYVLKHVIEMSISAEIITKPDSESSIRLWSGRLG